MDIGVLGTGVVGQALAAGLGRHGHHVVLGTRDPNRSDVPGVELAAFADTVDGAELVFLALHGEATVDVVSSVADRLGGKVVVDATNPLAQVGGQLGLFTSWQESLGERVQAAAPQAFVVKAYNTVGNALMVDPELPGGPPTMLIAGDHADAKATVGGLLESTGWEVADLGGIAASRWLEALALAWVGYGLSSGTWTHAFKVLRQT